MQNAELECKISICCEQIKHMCKYAELECRIRTEQNKKKKAKNPFSSLHFHAIPILVPKFFFYRF